jgi:hypothetical protein
LAQAQDPTVEMSDDKALLNRLDRLAEALDRPQLYKSDFVYDIYKMYHEDHARPDHNQVWHIRY